MNFVIFAVFCIIQYVAAESSTSSVQEDVDLDFCGFAIKYGQKCEGFDVVTEDGFILKLFRVQGDEIKHTTPVLVSHGNPDCSDAYAVRGNLSLVVYLAGEGYDAWYLNFRGNKYSRRHQTLNPDKDIKFWDFSYEDVGTKDFPANIDFVLNKTGQTQLSFITHSQGFAAFLALASIKKEYSDKVKHVCALAPFALGRHMSGPITLVAPLWPVAGPVLDLTGQHELNNVNSTSMKLYRKTCSGPTAYELCCKGMLESSGTNLTEVEKDFCPIMISHTPSSTAKKNYDHMVQNIDTHCFARYDYGMIKNSELYGSPIAPEFPLQNITIKVYLLVGENDKLASVEDAHILQNLIPNASYQEFKGKGHFDFVYGRSMIDYLFPVIQTILESDNN